MTDINENNISHGETARAWLTLHNVQGILSL